MLRSREGAWVGWPGVPDVDVEPLVEDGLQLHPVSMTAQEVEDYYEGFSNGTLWPLYHDVIVAPAFHRHWWQAYVKINERFAEAAAKVAAKGATVWVQDYQLQLLPAMLRELRPDLRIGFFLHIPFPPVELFMQMPFRAEILRGLLGADLVGFQQRLAAQNFVRLARHLLGLRYEGQMIQVDGRQVKAGAFPISIDTQEMERMAADPRLRFTLDGQAATVDDYLEIRPEAEDLIRQLIGEGRLAIGPWQILLDEFLELRTFESFPGLRHELREQIVDAQAHPVLRWARASRRVADRERDTRLGIERVRVVLAKPEPLIALLRRWRR